MKITCYARSLLITPTCMVYNSYDMEGWGGGEKPVDNSNMCSINSYDMEGRGGGTLTLKPVDNSYMYGNTV